MIRTRNKSNPRHSIDILLVDDDEGDVLLAKRALDDGNFFKTVHVVKDGVEAMAFLKQQGRYADAPRPDVILLDLNMPRKDGREVIREIKQDRDLRSIPVVVLTTSDSGQDVADMYEQHANCYITKAVDLEDFTNIINEIRQFWCSVVTLPPQ